MPIPQARVFRIQFNTGIQYGSEREKGKGVILKRVHPRALMADLARGVGARGHFSGPVPVEGSAMGRVAQQRGVARTAGNATGRWPAAGGRGIRSVDLCGLFGMRGGAPRRAKRGGRPLGSGTEGSRGER